MTTGFDHLRDKLRSQLDLDGFTVVKGVFNSFRIELVCQFWKRKFLQSTPLQRVTWAPYLGQENTIGYSKDKFQCLYRACDFYWNPAIHELTREMCLKANELRNDVIGHDPLFGTRYFDELGIFATASWYPPGKGFMQAHTDGSGIMEPMVHVLIPVSFRGLEYEKGGAFLINRKGVKIDVETYLEPGDVLLYDASLKHGVDLIQGGIGRFQVFPIPCRFTHLKNNPHALGRVPWRTYGVAKWGLGKESLRRWMGKIPNWR